MPLTYRIHPAERIVTITGDYAEPTEWRRVLGAVLRDAAYQSGFSVSRDRSGSRKCEGF